MALSIDYDVTITQSSRNAMRALASYARRNSVPIFLNTAREYGISCHEADTDFRIKYTEFLGVYKGIKCRAHLQDIPLTKVRNMISHARDLQLSDAETKGVTLLDDDVDNVDAALRAGFNAIHTPRGIRLHHVKLIADAFGRR